MVIVALLAAVVVTANAVRRAARDVSCPIRRDRRKVAGQVTEWLVITALLTAAAADVVTAGPIGLTGIAGAAACVALAGVNVARRAVCSGPAR